MTSPARTTPTDRDAATSSNGIDEHARQLVRDAARQGTRPPLPARLEKE